MMPTAQMSVQDELWLTMDRPNNLMVVDGAMVLRGPVGLQQTRDIYRAMVERFPVFARSAVPHGRGWAWQDHEGFDVAEHVTQVELPAPVTMAAVQQFLSEQRSLPLATDRPRWVAYLIPDVELADGTIGSAVVSRFHHAIADGVRLTQVMLGMCDSPDQGLEAVVARSAPESGAPNPVAAAGHAVSGAGHVAVEAVGGALHALRHPIGTATAVPGALAEGAHAATDLAARVTGAARLGVHGLNDGLELARHPDRLLDALEVLGVADHRSLNDVSSVTKLALGGTPRTAWTGKPGTTKAVAWSEPIPLTLVKQIGRARGATVNDVLLTAVAGALRSYLLEHDDLVDEIYWMVPVNLKPFAENLPPELGNYFALVFLPMALYHEDAESRLAHMHHVMDRIKHSDEAVMTFGLQRVVSQSPNRLAFFLTNFFANKAVGVLTNVPGPSQELSFGGVPVQQVVGFAPCSGDQPMTATIFSYNGGVTVGFATDAGLIPDPQVLSASVVDEVHALAQR
jgi:diacylglycerol O-acyltransferase